MLLKLTDLSVHFGGAAILQGVSLEVRSGKLVCLVGANGAGKTTLLRTISGLHRPSSGSITFQGDPINGLAPPRILRKGIVHVPQEARIWPGMSVLDNLRVGAHLRRNKDKIRQDLASVFEFFPILSERSKVRAGSLSGGERQMLALGRALMSGPELLMMDEPTAGLAPKYVELIAEISIRLNETGISVLLVEQNAEMALMAAGYGYVMERGRVALEGPTEELRTNQEVKRAYLGM